MHSFLLFFPLSVKLIEDAYNMAVFVTYSEKHGDTHG